MNNDDSVTVLDCGHGYHSTCYNLCDKTSCPYCTNSSRVIDVWKPKLAKKYLAQYQLCTERRGVWKLWSNFCLFYLFLEYSLENKNEQQLRHMIVAIWVENIINGR